MPLSNLHEKLHDPFSIVFCLSFSLVHTHVLSSSLICRAFIRKIIVLLKTSDLFLINAQHFNIISIPLFKLWFHQMALMFHTELSFLHYKLVACVVCSEQPLLNKFWLQTELFLSAPKEIPLTPPKPKPSATPEVHHVKPGNCAHHYFKLVCRDICSLKMF